MNKVLLIAFTFTCLFEAHVVAQNVPAPIPISFYGKVLDENDKPVAGAKVIFSVTNFGDPYSDAGVSQGGSDAQGLFSITGKTGLGIGVTVTKDGYYTPQTEQGRDWLPVAEKGTPLPTQASPAIFHLRKMGATESLKQLEVSIMHQEADGTPKKINLLTGQVDDTAGQISFRLAADKAHPDASGHYDWQYTMTVTGGGLLPRSGEFDFIAPPSGYQQSVTLSFPKSLGTGWAASSQKEYFIKLANGQYGRGEFIVNSGNLPTDPPFWNFRGYLNPTGSANLEVDPVKLSR